MTTALGEQKFKKSFNLAKIFVLTPFKMAANQNAPRWKKG